MASSALFSGESPLFSGESHASFFFIAIHLQASVLVSKAESSESNNAPPPCLPPSPLLRSGPPAPESSIFPHLGAPARTSAALRPAGQTRGWGT